MSSLLAVGACPSPPPSTHSSSHTSPTRSTDPLTSPVGGAHATRGDSSRNRWLFDEARLRDSPSFRDGFDANKELRYRRTAATVIQDMGERLNHHIKDPRQRISQLCMCAAMIHMDRFFVFHSFKIFDPRDVAAACLFLAGKSEECPRKLEHIVKVWWAVKFPKYPTYAIDVNHKHYIDGAQLLVTLENIILQTIAFDLQVDVPHPHVLSAMHKIVPGKKKITETAYWFASDMLHMTNWGVRYTARALACVCINLACTWAGVEIPPASDGKPWFLCVDASMTESLLNELTDNINEIYQASKGQHNLRRLALRNGLGEDNSDGDSSTAMGDRDGLAVLLPPPPAPTLLARPPDDDALYRLAPPPPPPKQKVDISQYKQKRLEGSATAGGGGSTTSTTSPRPNFMKPDITLLQDAAGGSSTSILASTSTIKMESRETTSFDGRDSRKRRVEGASGHHTSTDGGNLAKHTRTGSSSSGGGEHKHRRVEGSGGGSASASFATGPFAVASTEHRKRSHERNPGESGAAHHRQEMRDRGVTSSSRVLPEMDLKPIMPISSRSVDRAIGEKERDRHSSSSQSKDNRDKKHHHSSSSMSSSGSIRVPHSQPPPQVPGANAWPVSDRHSSSSSKSKPSSSQPLPSSLVAPPPLLLPPIPPSGLFHSPGMPPSTHALANGAIGGDASGGYRNSSGGSRSGQATMRPARGSSPTMPPIAMISHLPVPPVPPPHLPPSMSFPPPSSRGANALPSSTLCPPLPPPIDVSKMMATSQPPPPPPPPPPPEDLEEGELL